MAKQAQKIISIDWHALGRTFIALVKFLKWPVTLLLITYLVVTVPDYTRELRIDWQLILQYIDVIIWPLVVVGALWFIKPNLPNLLDRLEELNLLGNKAKFGKRQNPSADSQADELKELDPNAPNPTTKTNADLQIADDDTHALLSSYEAGVAFAQIHADIFGTQIIALRRLLDYNGGLKAEGLLDILEEHKNRAKGAAFTDLVPFMQFLLHNTLARYDAATDTYQLTNGGYYYLVFLYKANLLDRFKEW